MTHRKLITNARIFSHNTWLDGHCLVIENDRIQGVFANPSAAGNYDEKLDYADRLIVPGFIDTQVNGGGELLFNDAPYLTTLDILSRTHSRFGTCGFLPTLITDDWDTVTQACAAVNHAIEMKTPGILGIHLEGPFLNPARKGVHSAEKMQTLTPEIVAKIPAIPNGIMLITLAPECCDASLIQQLNEKNILVAAGHTAANYEQTKRALSMGLRSFTHLFNAMTPLTSREPGVVGAALEDKNSWCSLIVDGFHVHPATLKIACAAKPADKLVLVTDSMPSVGSLNKNFKLYGEEIFYRDGKLTTADGTLAGSDLSMIDAVKNTVRLLDLPLEQALRMASTHPAAMLGLENKYGKIEAGFKASFVVLDKKLNVCATWIDGEIAHLN